MEVILMPKDLVVIIEKEYRGSGLSKIRSKEFTKLITNKRLVRQIIFPTRKINLGINIGDIVESDYLPLLYIVSENGSYVLQVTGQGFDYDPGPNDHGSNVNFYITKLIYPFDLDHIFEKVNYHYSERLMVSEEAIKAELTIFSSFHFGEKKEMNFKEATLIIRGEEDEFFKTIHNFIEKCVIFPWRYFFLNKVNKLTFLRKWT